jgi:hypothetical protein
MEFYASPTEAQLHTRHATNNHHVYFDRADYIHGPRWRGIFRSLVPHVYPMLVTDHFDLHDQFDAPKMPRDGLMIDVIDEYAALNGVLNLVHEKRTNETYQITLEQWERIRG